MSLKRIMVIRHGEKPSVDGTVLGVTLEGISNSDELSVRGWQRAGAFVRFFAPADGQERAGIGRPESLFAQRQTEHVTSVRAPHTLGPLADFIGKPISTQFAKGEEELLAAALSAETATVLVAWEHTRRSSGPTIASTSSGYSRATVHGGVSIRFLNCCCPAIDRTPSSCVFV